LFILDSPTGNLKAFIIRARKGRNLPYFLACFRLREITGTLHGVTNNFKYVQRIKDVIGF